MHGNIGVQLTQTANFVIDIARLHWAAAGAIDAQNNALGGVVAKGVAQGGDDLVGTGAFLIGDHAAHFDQRGVTVALARGFLVHVKGRAEQENSAEQI